MVDREQQGDAVGRGILHLDPEWVQLVSEDGYVFYINRWAGDGAQVTARRADESRSNAATIHTLTCRACTYLCKTSIRIC